jgi:hypothetical protein
VGGCVAHFICARQDAFALFLAWGLLCGGLSTEEQKRLALEMAMIAGANKR